MVTAMDGHLLPVGPCSRRRTYSGAATVADGGAVQRVYVVRPIPRGLTAGTGLAGSGMARGDMAGGGLAGTAQLPRGWEGVLLVESWVGIWVGERLEVGENQDGRRGINGSGLGLDAQSFGDAFFLS